MTLKNNLKNSLKSSLQKEVSTVEDRFKKAETLFKGDKSTNENKKEEIVKSQISVKKTFTIYKSDIDNLTDIIKRAGFNGLRINKSQAIRLGLELLLELKDQEFKSLCSKYDEFI